MNRARQGLHVLALTMAALLAVSSAAAQTLHMPPHEKYVLKNGLTVLLLEKHGVPLINLYAIVKTGAAADPAGQDGLASVTAGLLRQGTTELQSHLNLVCRLLLEKKKKKKYTK